MTSENRLDKAVLLVYGFAMFRARVLSQMTVVIVYRFVIITFSRPVKQATVLKHHHNRTPRKPPW
jgi:hypothetical protein